MRTTTLMQVVLAIWNPFIYRIASGVAVFLLTGILFAGPVGAADLRVMKTGLGKGWISGPDVSCGIISTDTVTDEDTVATDCNRSFTSTTPVMLRANEHDGSRFNGWGGDCEINPATPKICEVKFNAISSVRAEFKLKTPIALLADSDPELTFTPEIIQAYLDGPGSNVNTPAEFVASLPDDFKENWILMPRSESLQTGTAEFPRILLISADGTKAFTLGLKEHTSYPGSHPNAIEYMQWDEDTNNFRFHEIVLSPILGLGDEIGPGVHRFDRPERKVSPDDPKCFACHSTRNVKPKSNRTPGTTGDPVGTVKFKSKPNWDTYDSWGGMLAFNRDRIYKGSVEAAAFRKLLNLWTWQSKDRQSE